MISATHAVSRSPIPAHALWSVLAVALLLSAGCATSRNVTAAIPCTYRFKMLTRPADQERVDRAIRAVAAGPVTKSGTVTYPEYRFHVARLADLDRLNPELLYDNPDAWLASSRRQVLNLRAAGVDFTFDSTDVSASAAITVTFHVKPGSRLYYKHPGGVESDITAKVDKQGKVTLPTSIKEGQKFIYARAVKDNVTRYIRINIFNNDVQDISKNEY
ncbi:MAG TPA: hypothetical protein P5026_11110 [Kiritimatiellia bacterium]|nr:hypothetical protein [Kiritimatiellia bacterium]HRU71419.1 hypothetical protein [Kiritimatiellia bacterium]